MKTPSSSKNRASLEASPPTRRLVLIGGGHAHVQVIRALKQRPPNLHVIVIDQEKAASYSGMTPGCVAGIYTPEQTLIHLEPLCEWADITFLQDEVIDIDLDRQCVLLRHSTDSIPYDAVSLDIGSKSRGLDDTPGARQYTIPTRPISRLVERIQEDENSLGSSARVAVVGGGAAGIELAMSIRGRWGCILGDGLQVTLLDGGEELLPKETRKCRNALENVLKDRQIEVRHKCYVDEITESHVRLADGSMIPYTHCIWAAGAAAHSLANTLRNRGLAVDENSWIRVNCNMQSVSHPNVFAAGDCCTIQGLPGGKQSPPKAGVYAVRAGPVLTHNLLAFFDAKPMACFNPQDDFLKLFSCGDGTAIGFRFGIALQGRWVFEMKDCIDQTFMNLFKKENLAETVEADSSNGQFDALVNNDDVALNPEEAAGLIQRTDPNVDFMTAWKTLRLMTRDENYRNAVMKFTELELIPQ